MFHSSRLACLHILLDDKSKETKNAVIDDCWFNHWLRTYKNKRNSATKDRQDFMDYAWYGDMDLVLHLWALSQTCERTLFHFLSPLRSKDFVHRYDIANAAQERVAKIVQTSNVQ